MASDGIRSVSKQNLLIVPGNRAANLTAGLPANQIDAGMKHLIVNNIARESLSLRACDLIGAMSGCVICRIRWRDEEIEIAPYFRFQLSLRDIEELLFVRGMIVTYETIRCWCDKFGKGFAHRVKAVLRRPGSTWHLDEMFVTLRSEPYLLWRAVDKHGADADILLQKRRDEAAAKRFFKRVLRSSPVRREIATDQLRSYPAAKAKIPELTNAKHVFVKAAARLNNRAENSHQPTRERERRMRGFPDPKRTQKFLSCFGPIKQHFELKRHLLSASLYRKQLAARFVAWREFAELAPNPSTAF